MAYGTQIGKKFHADGTAASYPGNTVIADVRPGNPAYDVMAACLQLLREAKLDELFIPLPKDSYHMTVIRGVNDLVRESAFWPDVLALDCSMEEADAYMAHAVASVENPGAIRMRFDRARITDEDFRILLVPADAAQECVLRAYRDAVAEAVGLRLPGHDAYTFHMTLAYTWRLPDAAQKKTLEKLTAAMDTLLAAHGEVLVDSSHFAYYEDMLSFYEEPVCRRREGEKE